MFLCYISSKILIFILSHETSLILKAQGVWTAWLGDYDTYFYCKHKQTSYAYEYNYVVNLLNGKRTIFISYFANSSEYRHPSQRLHISSPLAPLSEHQKTQDTLHADEPSPNIPLFELTGKDSIIKERLGIQLQLYFNC